MKAILLFALLTVGQIMGVVGQPMRTDSIRVVIDSSITLLRQFALHRDKPDWQLVRQETYDLARQASRCEDLGPAIAHLFEAVDDNHGWLAVGDTLLQWSRLELPYLSETLKKELLKGNSIVKKLFPGGIGYLRIPGMSASALEYDQVAQRLADSLYALQQEGARRFIIDLRLNTGGPMAPMIAGLSFLLGNGSFLGYADCYGKLTASTRLKNGVFSSPEGAVARVHMDNMSVRGMDAGYRKGGKGGTEAERMPVVVLTGHGTDGAGECVAIAFAGRPHTRFIGEPTAGNTTVNKMYPIIGDRVGIVIAGSMLADRRQHVYARNLIPDEWVPGGENFSDYGQDKKIQAAVDWLKKQ